MTYPIYNGTDYQGQPLVDAWWTRGWTSQNNSYIEATQPGGTPNFPSNLLSVEVTHVYFDPDGNPLPGFLTFQMTDNVTISDNGVSFTMPARYAGREADGSAFAQNNWGSGQIYIWRGQVAVSLFQTDSTYMTTQNGGPLYWFVQEHFLYGSQFFITVPGADAPGPVDLYSLIVSGTQTRYDYDPSNPRGNGTMPALPS